MLRIILSILSLISITSGSHNCFQKNGFTWCESTQKCQNNHFEPCLPITRECIYCLTEHFGDDATCGKGCTINIINEIQQLGIGTDQNGCLIGTNSIWCPSLNRCIDLSNEICRDNMNNPNDFCHDISCAMFCPNGFQKDESGCDICICDTVGDDICPLDPQPCDNYTYVCPKVTEITTCSNGGIEGHTTYQLSLILKENTDAKNIYAIYGNTHDNPSYGSLMFLPPAYQHDTTFNSNIGGINRELLQYEPSLLYDSWLTIGITDGDPQNLISSIGIDFNNWDDQTPLTVNNGAIFLLEPNEVLSSNNEYIIGQLTVLSSLDANVIVGVHGKRYHQGDNAWDERNVIFSLKGDTISHIIIPGDCSLWFNGCSYCVVEAGSNCIQADCDHLDSSYCVVYNTGH